MVAVVGGADFSNEEYGKINFAQTNISPGSSFKPYDYATMIQNRTDAGAGSILYDVQQPLPAILVPTKHGQTTQVPLADSVSGTMTSNTPAPSHSAMA